MSEKKSFQQQADDALKAVKEVSSQTIDAFKNSGAGKEILGEDGKFDKDDADHLKQVAGETVNKVKGAVLGEDGKFGVDDKQRLEEPAKNFANNIFKKGE